MNEDIKSIIDYLIDLNKDSIKHLKWELEKIRASAATPSMLDSIKVEYYGVKKPINQVSSINTTDSRTIIIQPWEKNMLVEISKSIINSNIGLNPQNNGDILIIDVPPLTELRRRDLVKVVKLKSESAKVSIRKNRKLGMDLLKDYGLSEDLIKVGEIEIEKITKRYTGKVDDLSNLKEISIMKV
jgi:ribosome recycling factor